jgi:hypothetical protein
MVMGTMNTNIIAGIIALGLLATAFNSPTHASDVHLTTKYSVSFRGVNVGKVKYSIRFSGDQYAISGGARANSVISIVAGAKAQFNSAGTISGRRLIPDALSVSYRTGRKKGHLKITYSRDGVTKIEASPKIKYKPNTVPVKKIHLLKVLDPVSTVVFPVRTEDVGNGRRVCNRVLPVFDGRTRMNLIFTYKSTSSADVEGFKGTTFVCSVRYRPVSGIRPAKRNIKFMKANRDMEITMARVGNSNIYSLFAFRVRTQKGWATGTAYHFSVQ